MRVPVPTPPYRGPAAHTTVGSNLPIHRIVIHSTVSPCIPGGADAVCAYFRTPEAGGSAHYVVDPSAVRQCVGDSTIAWHAPPNANSLGIELCDTPGPVPGDSPGNALRKAAKRRWRWNKQSQQDMLDLAAKLTAQLCAFYDVPVRYVGPVRLRLGRRGITTHAAVSLAFRQSTHWDPGFWPRRHFIKLVRAHHAALTNGRETPL